MSLVHLRDQIRNLAKGQVYLPSELDYPISQLLKRGFHGGFLIIHHKDSDHWIQMRKYIRSKGKYGIELSFPDAAWSHAYFEELQDYCDAECVPYRIDKEDPAAEMKFLYVDFHKDVGTAHAIAQTVLNNIFPLENDDKFFIRLNNGSPWDELIDSPEQKAAALLPGLREANKHQRAETGVSYLGVMVYVFCALALILGLIGIIAAWLFSDESWAMVHINLLAISLKAPVLGFVSTIFVFIGYCIFLTKGYWHKRNIVEYSNGNSRITPIRKSEKIRLLLFNYRVVLVLCFVLIYIGTWVE